MSDTPRASIRSAVLVCALVGCGEIRGDDAPAVSAAATSSTSEDDESSSSELEQRFDVASGRDGAGGDGGGVTVCRHVDALFAFDVSGSMSGEIAAMADTGLFTSFRDTLMNAGDGLVDFHLAVMDDAPSLPYYHDNGGAPGTTPCEFSTGASYMSSQSDDLVGEYACLFANAAAGNTHVGDSTGSPAPIGPGLEYLQTTSEMPARSAALSVSHAMALETNAGFLREDAVLLVVVVTDEDDGVFVDGELAKDPPWSDVVDQMSTIHAQLVAAKGGDPSKVIFVGIGAGAPDGCVGPYGDTVQEAEHLQYLVELFAEDDRGLFVDLCAGGLEEGVRDALEIVDSACDEFVPAG